MVAEQTEPAVTFQGTKAQKEMAEKAFNILRARGMFSSDYAPIRARLASLQEFLSADSEDAVREAIAANDHVFALVTEDDQAFVVTSRLGTPPLEMRADTRHTFAARFLTPEPAPERPLRTAKPVPQIVINAAIADEIADTRREIASVEHDLETIDGVDTHTDREEGGVTVELVTGDEAAAWQASAAAAEEAKAAEQAVVPEEETVPDEVPAAVKTEDAAEPVTTETEAVATETEAVEAELESEPVANEIAAPAEAEAAVPVEAEQESEPVEPVAQPEPVTTPNVADLSGFSDEAVAAAIQQTLRNDSLFANFGDQWMAEDQLHGLSRGNLRRIADDINEQERPLTDDVLAQDVLGARRSSPDFASLRFSLNVRLSSERGFEFLGTPNQPFWGTTDLPPIGTTRRKASEIGTDYRFLVDEVPIGSVEARSVNSIEHTLSFYEFTYGLLPLDEKLQALLPAPVMPDQRAAVLTMEIPQFENTVYLVEVRYPTQTRGGFILGLDDFYDEKMVPGAMLSIEATDNDGHYKIEYLEDNERQDRFLELDDRRAAKYVFRPLTYDTAVSDEWLVTESRFPGFNSEKPLSEKRRRRLEDVVEVTFERIGESEGTARIASFNDLLVAVNVERPASATALRAAIEGMSSVTDDGSGTLSYDTAS